MTSKTIFACAAAIGLCATAAHAEGGWVVQVGAKASVSPPYEGADHFVTRPSPTLSITRADKPYRFTPLDGGTTLSLIDSKYIVFGPMVRFLYGRGNQGQLVGLDTVRWAAEPGAFLDLWPAKWLRLHGEARHGIIGHHGYVADVGADLVYQGKRWDFSIGPRMGFGDQDYFERYFGVTPLENRRSPLIKTAYFPDGGRRYVGGEFGAAYHMTKRFVIKGDVGYHELSDRAALSPIVQVAGEKQQFTASVGASWSFNVGS
jgi:outer membrane protein